MTDDETQAYKYAKSVQRNNHFSENMPLLTDTRSKSYKFTLPDAPPFTNYKTNLIKHFGFTELHPLKEFIIHALVAKRQDVCAILAPGFGKSICYQLPATLTDGFVIVVTPLTFGIHEQVQRLNLCGITACAIETYEEYLNKLVGVNIYEYKIVFINTELILGNKAYLIFNNLKLASIILIAVLEAHCVSHYSHDFRTLFVKLGILKNTFPTVPILTLSSASSLQVRCDIISHLHLKKPLVLYSGFARPNLFLQVKAKENYRLVEDILSVISENKGPTLIYTFSRSEVFDLVTKLHHAGFAACKGLHSGLPEDTIKEVYESFATNRCMILVTTSACGLTISKPDIRNVIHCHVSRDIESYYQEIGRAGMDGLPSVCTLFYRQQDMDAQESTLSTTNRKLKFKMEITSDLLTEYVLTSKCRWTFLLSYFDGEYIFKARKRFNHNCCDNCVAGDTGIPLKVIINAEGQYELSEDCRIFLNVAQKTTRCLNSCVAKIQTSKNYNRNNKSVKWWCEIANLLKLRRFIQVKNTPSADEVKYYFFINQTALKFMSRNKDKIWCFINKEMRDELIKLRLEHLLQSPVKYSLADIFPEDTEKIKYNEELLQKLRDERLRLSSKLHCVPHVIVYDSVLKTLSEWRPKKLKALKDNISQIPGFSETLIDQVGLNFITVIEKYCDESNDETESESPAAKKIKIEPYEIADEQESGDNDSFCIDTHQQDDEANKNISICEDPLKLD